MKIGASDGFDERHHGVAVLLAQLAELLDRASGVALGAAVPHDGFNHGTGAAVVHAVGGAGALAAQPSSPQRRGATPAGAYVVDHEQTVLDHVGIGPYLLVGIARQTAVGVGEETRRVGELVAAGGPRRAVALRAAYAAEELAPAPDVGVVEVARGRHGQSAVPHHEVDSSSVISGASSVGAIR